MFDWYAFVEAALEGCDEFGASLYALYVGEFF